MYALHRVVGGNMKTQNKISLKKCIIGLLASAILIFADQWTKMLAVRKLKGAEPFKIIDGIFELHYLENRGAAFGILQNQRTLFTIFTVIILAVILYIYLFRIPQEKRYGALNLIIILLFSGAVGNFIDRLSQNYVVDFFYFVLIDFPIFNVADIYVVAAAGLLIVLGIFYYNEDDYERILPSKKKAEHTEKDTVE